MFQVVPVPLNVALQSGQREILGVEGERAQASDRGILRV